MQDQDQKNVEKEKIEIVSRRREKEINKNNEKGASVKRRRKQR